MKPLIGWDLGNVILPFSKEKWEASLLPESRKRAEELEILLELGKMDGKEFLLQVQKDCMPEKKISEIEELFCKIFTRDRKMENFLMAFLSDEAFCNVLLSNTNSLHWKEVKKHIPHILCKFDEIVLSFQCHLRKPDPRFFLSSKLLAGKEYIFIDDQKKNIEGATQTGAIGILYNGSLDELRNLLGYQIKGDSRRLLIEKDV